MGVGSVLALLGGVALFLFGMGLMGDNLKLVAGQRLELILYRLTSTRLKGVLLGTGVTALIQSSSATSAMVVGFVNSGLMKLAQATGIILGANVGTSITGWILCLSYIGGDSEALSLLSSQTLSAVVALVGILLRMTAKEAQRRHAGDILLGFAVLMYGMQAMSASVAPLKESPGFLRLMTMFEHPLLGILIGAAVTAVLQSNSASVGILQALSVTGAVPFSIAFPMIMGMGIGAAVPVLLSAVGANRDGRRTALIYLFTGLFGTLIFSALFYSLNAVRPLSILSRTVGPVEIALINSLFRIGSILILFPFLSRLEELTGRLVPARPQEEKADRYTVGIERLEERFLSHPGLALEQSRDVIYDMARLVQADLEAGIRLMDSYSSGGFQKVADMEEAADKYEDRLGTYLMKISSRELNRQQTEDLSKYLHSISDFERISDHALNLAEAAREVYEKKASFSDAAKKELSVLRAAVEEIVAMAVSAFVNNDHALARKVEPLEDVVDGLCDEMKMRHVRRLQEGTCTLHQGFIFNDLITNYERVADHCSNIAVAIIELEEDNLDSHEYINNLRNANSPTFQNCEEAFARKYVI